MDYQCPFCHAQNNYTGDGLSDGESAEDTCEECDRTIVITASVQISYEAFCPDGEHDVKEIPITEGVISACSRCEWSEVKLK